MGVISNDNKCMRKKGYYNEFNFVNELNGKFVYQLNNNFVSLLKRIYNNKLNMNDYVLCWKSFKTDKADIVISINDKHKYVSIKNGKNNSVHLEPLADFICFLKDNNISDGLIERTHASGTKAYMVPSFVLIGRQKSSC